MEKRGRPDGVKRRTRAKSKSVRGEVKGTNQLPALRVCPSWRTAGFWGSDANLTLLETCVPTGQTAWRVPYPLFYLRETHHFISLSPHLVSFSLFFPSFCSYFSTQMHICKCIQTILIIKSSVKTPHITDSQSFVKISRQTQKKWMCSRWRLTLPGSWVSVLKSNKQSDNEKYLFYSTILTAPDKSRGRPGRSYCDNGCCQGDKHGCYNYLFCFLMAFSLIIVKRTNNNTVGIS